MDRHDSAWALGDKAVLIRNRRESRFGRETMLSMADLAYVVRTEHYYTLRVRVGSTPRDLWPLRGNFSQWDALFVP